MPGGRVLRYFANQSLEIVKLDLTFEAGSQYQHLISQAHAANQLLCEASRRRSIAEVAEFLDFRGIETDRFVDVSTATLSFFLLRRHADDLLPMVAELLAEPEIGEKPFAAYLDRRRAQLRQYRQKTSFVARNRFYELLFGPAHPLGCYARPDDVDHLTLDGIRHFAARRYPLQGADVLLAGKVDETLLRRAEETIFALPAPAQPAPPPLPLPAPQPLPARGVERCLVPSAVQCTLRLGRILPFSWNDPDYALFLVLNTLLGGYFGSRLMTALREEKGYTYGIYSQCQMYRGFLVFFVTADVAAEAADDALAEVLRQIDRLKNEPVPADELERVKNFMLGDFMRSVDGVIEVSERFRQMQSAEVTEQFTTHYLEAVRTATPPALLALARRTLSDLLIVTAAPPA